MDYATIRLSNGPDGKVTACVAASEIPAPYDLAVIADEVADALSRGGIDMLHERLGQIADELRLARLR